MPPIRRKRDNPGIASYYFYRGVGKPFDIAIHVRRGYSTVNIAIWVLNQWVDVTISRSQAAKVLRQFRNQKEDS